jgi:hypothetical protein
VTFLSVSTKISNYSARLLPKSLLFLEELPQTTEKKLKEAYIFRDKKMETKVETLLLMIFSFQKGKNKIYIVKKNKILHLQIIRYY